MKYREPFRLSQNQEHHHNNRFVLFGTTIQDRDRIPNPQGQPSRSLGSQHYLHSVVLLVCMLMSEFLLVIYSGAIIIQEEKLHFATKQFPSFFQRAMTQLSLGIE